MAQPMTPGRTIHLEAHWDGHTACHAGIVADANAEYLSVLELDAMHGQQHWVLVEHPDQGGWHWPTECPREWPSW